MSASKGTPTSIFQLDDSSEELDRFSALRERLGGLEEQLERNSGRRAADGPRTRSPVRESLGKAIEELERRLEEALEERDLALSECEKSKAAIREAASQMESLRAREAEGRAQLRAEFDAQIRAARMDHERSQQAVRSRLESAQGKNALLLEQVQALKDRGRTAVSEIEHAAGLKKQAEAKLEELAAKIAALEGDFDSRLSAARTNVLREAERTTQEALQSQKTRHDNTLRDVQANSEIMARQLRRQIEDLRSSLSLSTNRNSQEIARLETARARSGEAIRNLTDQLARSDASLRHSEQARASLERSLAVVHQQYKQEIQNHRAAAEAAKSELQAGLKESAERSAETREQLRISLQQNAFHTGRNQSFELEKKIQRELIKKLAAESELAGARHPLADYLSFISEQILELELEMVDIPTGSPQRRPIEANLRKLATQRHNLERMVKESRARFDTLARSLRDSLNCPDA